MRLAIRRRALLLLGRRIAPPFCTAGGGGGSVQLQGGRAGQTLLLETVDNLLFDCDGVLWNGDTVVDGAPLVLQQLGAAGKRLLFITNNRSPPRALLNPHGILLLLPSILPLIACGGDEDLAPGLHSTKSRQTAADKFQKLGFSRVDPESILTSGYLAGQYLAEVQVN